jgi:hypothetical protein
MNYKALSRKLKIEQHESYYEPGWIHVLGKGKSPLVAPVVYLVL